MAKQQPRRWLALVAWAFLTALSATEGVAAVWAQPETPALNATALSENRQLLDQICYTLTATDTYGDGWNGGHWTWADASGATVEVGTVTHNTATETLCLDSTDPCYTFAVSDQCRPTLFIPVVNVRPALN